MELFRCVIVVKANVHGRMKLLEVDISIKEQSPSIWIEGSAPPDVDAA